VAGVAAAFEQSPGGAVWDDAVVSRTGIFIASPYPMLLVNSGRPDQPPQTILVVSAGKCGADEEGGYCGPLTPPGKPTRVELLAKLDHQLVEARGTIMRRDGHAALELEAGLDSIRAGVGEKWREFPVSAVQPLPLGQVTVRGVIVDSKCYLGAMKPGDGKVHRDCAVRCISGGIPPLLVSRDDDGSPVYYLLTNEKGGACNAQLLPFVGDEVEVQGVQGKIGDLDMLAATSIQRS
jgi:hypothetical protein